MKYPLNNISKALSTLVLTLALSACGGSGSSSDNTVTPDDDSVPDTSEPVNSIDNEFSLWLSDLANNHILPSYQNLSDTALALNTRAASFCLDTEASAADLTSLQVSWREVMTSWQTIQWLKVGPVLEDNRIFRMHYWPDSKDTVTSGLNTLLMTSEEVTESYISTRSVGSQGLPAIEQILFSASDESLLNASDKVKRCEVLTAISANVATMSEEINSEWQVSQGNYHQQLTEGIGDFTSQKDAVEELVTNWLEQLESVKDEKMLTPLGSAAPGFPDEVEHVLSDSSMLSIQQNIDVFNVIYTAGNGHGFDDILTDYLDQQNIATEMTVAIDDAISASAGLTASDATLLKTTEGRVQIALTIDQLRAVRDLLTVDLVQAMDINIGFNSNDGD